MTLSAPSEHPALPDADLAVPHPHVCPDCGHQHESIVRGSTTRCPDCIDRIQSAYRATEAAARESADAAAKAARATQWEALCPPDYRTTAWRSHPELSPVCHFLAKHWSLLSPTRPAIFGPERGLLIYGPTGRGKTRCMYGILRRLHFAGIPCHAVEAVRYAEHAATVHDFKAPYASRRDSQHYLDLAKRARVLFFDDLGKEGITPGFARAFHDLLEHRKARHLPTLVTSERVGEELAQHLGTNYADGIVRRLRETCAIFSTEGTVPDASALTPTSHSSVDT